MNLAGLFDVLYAMLALMGFSVWQVGAQEPTCSKNFSDPLDEIPRCSELLMGQYMCEDPEIDIETQQAKGCTRDGFVKVKCKPAPKIVCIPEKEVVVNSNDHPCEFSGEQVGFLKKVPCKWTNGYNFETALLLSVFLGMFGIDRFYLGYPAIGLLKFSTLGFFFLGQLIDVLLIATQTVKPSDGSEYIIDYFGAGLVKIVMNNETVLKLPDD